MRALRVPAAILLAFLAGALAGGRRPGQPPPPAAEARGAPEEPSAVWTCSMHPEVRRKGPGLCPICHMALERVRPTAAAGPGTEPAVAIEPAVVQNMGVRLAPATKGALKTAIRAFGTLVEAQPLQHDVSLKIGGWIERLHADREGILLEKGAPLFDLYSPDLVIAEGELLTALRLQSDLGDASGSDPEAASRDVERARAKLRLWDVPAAEIAAIEKEGTPRRAVTFQSPWGGDLVEKRFVQGAYVPAGERILRIVDHSTLWIEARIYEHQIPLVKAGQEAVSEVRGFEDRDFRGKVVLVHPHVDPATRTATARIEIPNPERDLKPGMYASVRFDVLIAIDAVLVPREAVLDTGTRRIVFVKGAEAGTFIPRIVRVGASGNEGMVRILDGLSPGEEVVVSGQLLIDAESRTAEALRKMKPAGNAGDRAPAAAPAHRHDP